MLQANARGTELIRLPNKYLGRADLAGSRATKKRAALEEDFCSVAKKKAPSVSGWGPIHLRVGGPLCLDWDNRDNHEGDWIHDHELVLEEEAQEVTERRLDEHDLLGHQE